MTHEEAIREWIARKIRARGHKEVTRAHISNVRYAVEYDYSSDVTPGDDPAAALVCDLKMPRSVEHEHAETLEHIKPADLVAELMEIYNESPERTAE